MAYVNRCVGTALDAPAVAALLSRMALDAAVAPGGAAVRVRVPPTRSDVLHACDVMEVRTGSAGCPCRCPQACHARPELSCTDSRASKTGVCKSRSKGVRYGRHQLQATRLSSARCRGA